MIGGESGSGKTHLGLYAAKIGLPDAPQRTLTLYLRIFEQLDGLKKLVEEVPKAAEGKELTDAQKEERNELVAAFVCERMCDICDIRGGAREHLVSIKKKDEKNVPPDFILAEKCFSKTVLVMDEVIVSKTLMKTVSTSIGMGFVENIARRKMDHFFGTIYIVCCSTVSKDVLLTSGSSISNCKTIHMQPSCHLFKSLIKNDFLYEKLLTNRFMKIVENRRCATFCFEYLQELSKTIPTIQLGGSSTNLILSTSPTQTVVNSISGYLVMLTATRYATMNALHRLTKQQRVELAAAVIKAFLKMPSVQNVALPFTSGGSDPIATGVVSVHASEESPLIAAEQEKDNQKGKIVATPEKRTFAFSRAQMLLACCFYGESDIPMNSPDTFESYGVAMLALCLAGFIKEDAHATLVSLFSLLDPHYSENCTIGKTVEVNVLLPKVPKARGFIESLQSVDQTNVANEKAYRDGAYEEDENNTFPFSVGLPHTGNLIKDIQASQEKYYICVILSPPSSPYADAIIVCGQVLFLIYCKKTSALVQEGDVRKEILNMGLVPESNTDKELEAYAKNIAFTSELCGRLGVMYVVPVFSVEKMPEIRSFRTTKVSTPTKEQVKKARTQWARDNSAKKDKNASSEKQTVCMNLLAFVPSTEFKATFIANKIDEEKTVWTYCNDEDAPKRKRSPANENAEQPLVQEPKRKKEKTDYLSRAFAVSCICTPFLVYFLF